MAEETIRISTVLDTGNSQKSIKEIRNEVKGYKDDLTNLDRGSKEYNETLQQLAASQGQINAINQDVRASTLNLTDVYGQLNGVAQGVVGGFTAVKAAGALLGSENEALAETFVQLQAGS